MQQMDILLRSSSYTLCISEQTSVCASSLLFEGIVREVLDVKFLHSQLLTSYDSPSIYL